ncbi:MAG: ECF-type sigma factor [Gemmatimonadota bacterium]
MVDQTGDVTRLAQRWSDGDDEAFDRLIDLVYEDLRRIAHRHVRDTGGSGTINTTALVHEAYLKIGGTGGGDWPGRASFLAFCSKAMRRILIDYARQRQAEKRGGDRVQVPLTPQSAVVDRDATDVLALDEALGWLEGRDPALARIAECRFFGGLSVSETADALDISTRTVERGWARARAYLREALDA